MEEQLPTPLIEIIVLHLYISSITLLFGLVALILMMKSRNNFTWQKYSLNSFLLLFMTIISSLQIWQIWPFEFDIMFGPFNLPTLISLLVILGLFALIIKTKSI